jgi:hypothetical protein
MCGTFRSLEIVVVRGFLRSSCIFISTQGHCCPLGLRPEIQSRFGQLYLEPLLLIGEVGGASFAKLKINPEEMLTEKIVRRGSALWP